MKFLLILFALMLSACANLQLPIYDESRSVLIIPKSNVNSTIKAWSNRYSLEITRTLDNSGEHSNIEFTKMINVPNNNDDYLLIDNLPSGSYLISGIIRHRSSKWANRGTIKDAYTKAYIPFHLNKGKITVLDKLFNVNQYKGFNGSLVYISADFVEMHKSAKDFIISKLMADPQSNKWDVYNLAY